ncbi:metalloprotease m41 ftsh [Penicillium digitatum]|nr:metalloprotease m41 ftsh [Penicillium digitatum]
MDTSLEESEEQLHVDDAFVTQQVAGRRTREATASRKLVLYDDEIAAPIISVFTLLKMDARWPQLVAGLHAIEPARDIIGQNGDTFEFHATHLVTAVVTQIFSYMIDSSVRYGYICTGEAFVFLHIPEDPTTVQYHLCVPNQDVQEHDEYRLHRTSVGQVLAFTLQALAAEPPSQEWHDVANEELSIWKVEYLDVLRDIPETIRKEPPSFVYRSSFQKSYNTRSRCKPGQSTPPEEPSSGASGSEEDLPSPSTMAAVRKPRGRGGNEKQTPASRRGIGQAETKNGGSSSSQKTGSTGIMRP